MVTFDEYASKYETIRMERRDGVLQMTFHTNGGSPRWGVAPHPEVQFPVADVGNDPENKVIILTGTGDECSGQRPSGAYRPATSARAWDRVFWEGRHLLQNLLDIEVPMIAAVNGPALRHSELALLCDVVLASET